MDTKNLKPDVGGGYPWDKQMRTCGTANPAGNAQPFDFT